MHPALKLLGLGLAANAALAIPYYYLVERRCQADSADPKALEHARLGTVALVAVPWAYVGTHLPIVIGASAKLASNGLRGARVGKAVSGR